MTIPARRPPAQLRPADMRRAIIPGVLFVCGFLIIIGDGDGAVGMFFLIVGGLGVLWVAQKGQRLAHAREIAAIQSTEIRRYHVMSPRQFEEAIAYLCSRDGCFNVQVTGGANDLGADVIAVSPDGRRIVIQCKRYGPTTKVGSPDLQRFGGTCFSVHGAQVAAVVTTNIFTAPAANYATQHGIRLLDEQALAAWASRTGPAPWT